MHSFKNNDFPREIFTLPVDCWRRAIFVWGEFFSTPSTPSGSTNSSATGKQLFLFPAHSFFTPFPCRPRVGEILRIYRGTHQQQTLKSPTLLLPLFAAAEALHPYPVTAAVIVLLSKMFPKLILLHAFNNECIPCIIIIMFCWHALKLFQHPDHSCTFILVSSALT